MNVSKTAQIWLDYHRAHYKKNTVKAYGWTIGKFCDQFGDIELLDLTGMNQPYRGLLLWEIRVNPNV